MKPGYVPCTFFSMDKGGSHLESAGIFCGEKDNSYRNHWRLLGRTGFLLFDLWSIVPAPAAGDSPWNQTTIRPLLTFPSSSPPQRGDRHRDLHREDPAGIPFDGIREGNCLRFINRCDGIAQSMGAIIVHPEHRGMSTPTEAFGIPVEGISLSGMRTIP